MGKPIPNERGPRGALPDFVAGFPEHLCDGASPRVLTVQRALLDADEVMQPPERNALPCELSAIK